MATTEPKPLFDCSKCPAYCCSYEEIPISKADIRRLAKHFGLTPEVAERRFTKSKKGQHLLRHQKDHLFDTVCMFLDKETRGCTVYDARPKVCHLYPESRRCGYWEFLKFERNFQGDPDFVARTGK